MSHNKSKKLLIIELILIVLFIAGFIKERIKNQPIRRELSGLKQELKKLRDENETIKQRLLYLQNPENKKKEARDKLNLSDPGEKMIILPEGF